MDLRAASMKTALQTTCRGHYYVIDVCKAIGDLLYYVFGQHTDALPLPGSTMSPNLLIGLSETQSGLTWLCPGLKREGVWLKAVAPFFRNQLSRQNLVH